MKPATPLLQLKAKHEHRPTASFGKRYSEQITQSAGIHLSSLYKKGAIGAKARRSPPSTI